MACERASLAYEGGPVACEGAPLACQGGTYSRPNMDSLCPAKGIHISLLQCTNRMKMTRSFSVLAFLGRGEILFWVHFGVPGNSKSGFKLRATYQRVSVTSKDVLISLNRIKLTPKLSLYVYWLRRCNKYDFGHSLGFQGASYKGPK